jgi:hypothetical protein
MDLEEIIRHEENDSQKGDHEIGNNEETKTGGEERVELLDGIHVRKKSLWMMAGGVVGALAVLGFGKAFRAVRPVAVSALKESYGFKEWLGGKVEAAKEDMEDVVAEAIFSYHKDLAATADVVRREKEILDKIEKVVKGRSAVKDAH